jgi:ornithine decarboxylase antizyme
MKSVFLGERGTDFSSVGNVDAYNSLNIQSTSLANSWLELWDYAGGCSFRGFVATSGNEKCLFTFFNSSVTGRDLKQG